MSSYKLLKKNALNGISHYQNLHQKVILTVVFLFCFFCELSFALDNNTDNFDISDLDILELEMIERFAKQGRFEEKLLALCELAKERGGIANYQKNPTPLKGPPHLAYFSQKSPPENFKKFIFGLVFSAGYDRELRDKGGVGLLLGFNLGMGKGFSSVQSEDGRNLYKNNFFLVIRPRVGLTFEAFAIGITPGLILTSDSINSDEEKITSFNFMPGAFFEFRPSDKISLGLCYDFVSNSPNNNNYLSSATKNGLLLGKITAHKISFCVKARI